jgi:predicted CXXCH cytochrome family protein
VIVVDSGRVAPPSIRARREEDQWRTEATYQAMATMGYDAVGLTIADFIFGSDFIQEVRTKDKVPFVACNIVYTKTKKPFVDPYVVKTVGNFVVAVIGLSSKEDFQYAASSRSNIGSSPNPMLEQGVADLTFLDPGEALDAALKELQSHRPRPNAYVLISAIDPREMAGLIREHPEITVVLNDGQITDIANVKPQTVTGPDGKPIQLPPRANTAQLGGTWVYFASAQYTGKTVGEVTLDYQDGKIASQDWQQVNLDAKYADDPAIRKVVGEFYAMASKKVELEGTAEPRNAFGELERDRHNGFIGAEACQKCHDHEYALWEETHHADAALNLVTANKQYHPDCVSCHNTGYGYPTGFQIADQTPTLHGVQCESCHGPGKRHADANSAKFIRAKPGKEYCVGCHDSQQSPDFQTDFNSYYERIKHTEKAIESQRQLRDPRTQDAPGRRMW